MASAPASATRRPRAYLLLNNVGKKHNFGQLIRSACAFGVSEVAVVGAKRITELSLFGNQGTSGHADFRFFDSLEEARGYFKSVGAAICGVEIGRESKVVFDREKVVGPLHGAGAASPWPFAGDTCFMLGNEGSGMSDRQLGICDFLTYIPQHSGATASLNVLVAGSIVLHHFSLYAGMEEVAIEGHKFKIEQCRGKLERFQNPSAAEQEEIDRKRAERAAKVQKVEEGGGV